MTLATVGKAARMYAANSPLKVEDVEFPNPAPSEVLVRIKASGLCFSDVHALKGELPPTSLPLTLGHEGAGIIEMCGRSVRGFRKGQRVVIDYVNSCGKCEYCKSGRDNLCSNAKLFGFDVNGSFAEYALVPARSLVKLSSNIPFDQGAVLGCAVSTPYHAFKRAGLKKGQTAALIGIGGVGYHGALLSKMIGAKFAAVDISEQQLARTKEIGADLVVNSVSRDPVAQVRAWTNQSGVDAAFDFVGSTQTIKEAVSMVKKGGVAVLVGITPGQIQLDSLDFLLREVELVTSIDHTHGDLVAVERLVSTDKIDLSKSITHRVALDEINDGFGVLQEKTHNPIRVAVVQ